MKRNNILYTILIVVTVCYSFTSCNDFLDREPLSSISPESYYTDAGQLWAYTDYMYEGILPDVGGNTYGLYGWDQDTDNQLKNDAPHVRFDDGEWRVPASGGDWNFESIYRCNYFFSMIKPKFGEDLSGSQNTIVGDLKNIKHYIGEMYVLRALEYFNRYQTFGDFPIITEPLTDDIAILTEASKRAPRNEVARFILSDLDKAITLMADVDHNTTRINRDLALLIKSRVALHEATWLKYFKGTAFVPNGEGWPGKAKDYNANYQYPSGNIDNEINWFLDQAMAASKEVAEKYKANLTENTGVLQQSTSDPKNPYYDMYVTADLSTVKEIMLWRRYAKNVKMHGICIAANIGSNNATGVLRSFVQNFLMTDGLPVYAHGTYAEGDGYYKGDKTIANVRFNRDTRLSLFLTEPGQINILNRDTSSPIVLNFDEPYPDVVAKTSYRYPTGYVFRKGASFYMDQYEANNASYTGLPLYRSVEALLNYMEASFERTGSLNGTAREYWQLIRRRAKVSENIDATIGATNMSEEAKNDWAAYSAGQLISATLYNIRRERRSEFVAEGLRYMDLRRWRSMDQMITQKFIPEGMHLWNTPMQQWYDQKDLIADGSSKAVVSSPNDSEYLRPYRKRPGIRCYDGYMWHLAHYLTPIAIKHFQVTAPDGATIANSPIYQNPYWPTDAAMSAEK